MRSSATNEPEHDSGGPPERARCVIIFTRSPREEAAAKRLRGGERFFATLLRQTAMRAAVLPGVDLLITADPWVSLPRHASRIRQPRGSFSQRLRHCLDEAHERGYQEIVLIGGDTPGLRTSDLEAAFSALSSHDLVLGPASDGGVYLIGLRGAPTDQLSAISWCTRSVFGQLLDSCPSTAVLREVHPDIDRV